MSGIFHDKSVLLVSSQPAMAKLLGGILKILQFKNIEIVDTGDVAFKHFQDNAYDLIITEIFSPPSASYSFVSNIRQDSNGATQNDVPVILIAGQSLNLDIDAIRKNGFTDLLLSPFSFDDVKTRLDYLLETLKTHETPDASQAPVNAYSPNASSPNAEEDNELVKTLLTHYMQHHESVLKKLHFAQDATAKSIAEIREVSEELQALDNASITQFSKFEAMWTEIIDMFVKGGVSEDDIFKIENIVSTMPEHIKEHYNQLTQQDKSFLKLVESMNHDAYRKARTIAIEVQAQPNPLTGMVPDQYREKGQDEDDDEMAFIFRPTKKA